MAPNDVASILPAPVIRRNVNPRLSRYMAPYDVVSIIRQPRAYRLQLRAQLVALPPQPVRRRLHVRLAPAPRPRVRPGAVHV